MAEKIEKFDLSTTLLSNTFWLLTLFVIVFFFKSLLDVIKELEPTLSLLGIIIICFSTIKLLSWIKHPIIIFKTKKGRLSYR